MSPASARLEGAPTRLVQEMARHRALKESALTGLHELEQKATARAEECRRKMRSSLPWSNIFRRAWEEWLAARRNRASLQGHALGIGEIMQFLAQRGRAVVA